jgi:nucleotide-binding universal stress UspA family protein
MIRSILVPLDGSAFGEQALPLAHTLAVASAAALHLVHIHVPEEIISGDPLLFVPQEVGKAILDQRRGYLNDVASRLAAGLKAPPSTTLVEGAVVQGIEEQVKNHKTDLVVMTTHGRGPLSRAWFGSTTMALLRKLGVPMVLVRPEEQVHDVAAVRPVRHVVVALDGSAWAEQVLGPATELARIAAADCTLIRVIAPLVRGRMDSADLALSTLDQELLAKLTQLHDDDRSAAARYLEQKAQALRTQSLSVRTRLLIHEQPASAILDEANAIGADLIAVATHGRTAIPRLFLGSVADKVVRGAHCPVLIYRPPGSGA